MWEPEWWRMTCEELNGKGRRHLEVFTEAYRVFAEGGRAETWMA